VESPSESRNKSMMAGVSAGSAGLNSIAIGFSQIYMYMKPERKLIRITTVPVSLQVLLRHQLAFMSSGFDVLAVSSPGLELEEAGRQEGVRTAAIPMTRSITPLKDLRALLRLYFLFRKETPSIVHTHTPKAGLLGMIAAWLARVPVRLHTVAGLPLMESKGMKRTVMQLAEHLTYRCATRVYPNSFKLAAFIRQKRWCGKEKLKVLGNGSSNGIDMEYFSPNEEIQESALELKSRLQIKEDDFVFVFIGRLVKDKGIEELADAFTRLKIKYPSIKLLLVGPDEPGLDPLSGRIKKMIGTDKDIISVGFRADIRPYLAISHVLTFPSYREGFPNVPMQAGCFSLPSIVTDINGCNEIIEQEKNGLIIPVKNIQALYDAMESLLTDRDLCGRLAANARPLISSRYDQRKLWNSLLDEYHTLLSRTDRVHPAQPSITGQLK
jgi:glycosyltransferase involved in cell wall biosynthesis